MTIEREVNFKLEEAIRVLEATPQALRALLEGLPDAWLDFREEPEAWDPKTVLVHYLHNEVANWMPRVRMILSDAEVRRFAPFQQLPDESEYGALEVPQLLDKFSELRQTNVAALHRLALAPADYAREAEHPSLGVVNLEQLLATWVVHDLNHLNQIAKTMAKRYQEAVGPWKAFLAILEQ